MLYLLHHHSSNLRSQFRSWAYQNAAPHSPQTWQTKMDHSDSGKWAAVLSNMISRDLFCHLLSSPIEIGSSLAVPIQDPRIHCPNDQKLPCRANLATFVCPIFLRADCHKMCTSQYQRNRQKKVWVYVDSTWTFRSGVQPHFIRPLLVQWQLQNEKKKKKNGKLTLTGSHQFSVWGRGKNWQETESHPLLVWGRGKS